MARRAKVSKRIESESGFPVPETRRHSIFSMCPYDSMKVGESFEYPTQGINAARSSASRANREFKNKHFVAGEYAGKVRVWRSE